MEEGASSGADCLNWMEQKHISYSPRGSGVYFMFGNDEILIGDGIQIEGREIEMQISFIKVSV